MLPAREAIGLDPDRDTGGAAMGFNEVTLPRAPGGARTADDRRLMSLPDVGARLLGAFIFRASTDWVAEAVDVARLRMPCAAAEATARFGIFRSVELPPTTGGFAGDGMLAKGRSMRAGTM
jgi:hypothetical protein